MMMATLLMSLSLRLTSMINQKYDLLLAQEALIKQAMIENETFYEVYQQLDGNCELDKMTFLNYEIYLNEDKTIEKVVEKEK